MADKKGPQPCARCHVILRGKARDNAVYSTHTGAYYCGPLDDRACARRARTRARRLRQEV